MKRKPDALVVLAFVFALGVLVSTITQGGNGDADFQRFANTTGITVHLDDAQLDNNAD